MSATMNAEPHAVGARWADNLRQPWLRRAAVIVGVSVLLALALAAVGGTEWADTFRVEAGGPGRGPHGPGPGGWAWLRPVAKELVLVGVPMLLVAGLMGRRGRSSRAARSRG